MKQKGSKLNKGGVTDNFIMQTLQEILLNNIYTEPMTLYLLVALRKTIEKNSKYHRLKFYADWSVHAEKDRIIEDVKDLFLSLEKDINAWFFSKEEKIRCDINNRVFYFLSFEDLRKELDYYLRSSNLPHNLTSNPEIWKNFSKSLNGLISNSPLKLDGLSRTLPVRKIEKFYVSKEISEILIKEFPSIKNMLDEGEIIAWQIWITTSSFPLVGFVY